VGGLTRHTVNIVTERGGALVAECKTLTFDCEPLTFIDSAGLALLIDWVVEGKRRGHDIKIINASTQLRALAEVSNLEKFLWTS